MPRNLRLTCSPICIVVSKHTAVSGNEVTFCILISEVIFLQVAEKRKNLLDELAIKYQTESDQHRESIKHKDEEHSSKLHELSTEIDQLNVSTCN